jgi:hypothetical protein
METSRWRTWDDDDEDDDKEEGEGSNAMVMKKT